MSLTKVYTVHRIWLSCAVKSQLLHRVYVMIHPHISHTLSAYKICALYTSHFLCVYHRIILGWWSCCLLSSILKMFSPILSFDCKIKIEICKIYIHSKCVFYFPDCRTLGIQVATIIFYWYWSYTTMHITLTDLWVFNMTKNQL